jgi:intein-encoded DNA endonuclease-like protein
MQGKESRPFKFSDYEKVIKLKKKGLSQNKIAKIVGVSSATVWHWTNTNRKPRSDYAIRMLRPFPKRAQKLSEDLAYIYGVLLGDGSIEVSTKGRKRKTKTHRIVLNVTDKDFAKEFYSRLKSWCSLNPTFRERDKYSNHQTKYGNWIKGWSHFYVVRLSSKRAVEYLLNHIKSKTYSWEVPKSILNCNNKRILGVFLRGFFDSEGYPVFWKGKFIRLEFEVFGTKGVNQISKIMNKLGIEHTITQGKKQKLHGTKVVRILRNKSVENFKKHVNFTIARKRI